MNQVIMMDKLGVLSKCLAILTTVSLIVACDNREDSPPVPPPEVLKSIKGSIEKPVEGLVIKLISNDGLVLLGKPEQSLRDLTYIHRYKRLTPYKLEGKGQVGDRVVAVFYYEDQLLANGAARKVIVERVVRSVNNRVIEEYFNSPKGE
jgi:hypothetical protein